MDEPKKKDQVMIHCRNDDGDMLISRRKSNGEITVGEAKPLEEGKPLPKGGEVIYLKGHEPGCPLYDVVDSYDLSGAEESVSSGPSMVNSPVFKANWDSIFGGVMSDSTDGKNPFHVADQIYILNTPPNQKSCAELREMTMRLKELADKHDIQIETPTHDYMTLTGRLEDLTRFKPDFVKWFSDKKGFGISGGEMLVLHAETRDPAFNMCHYYDFTTIERRILAQRGQLWVFLPDPFEDMGEGGVE